MVVLHDALSLKIANKVGRCLFFFYFVLHGSLTLTYTYITTSSLTCMYFTCNMTRKSNPPPNTPQIPAHRNRLVALAFSLDGTRLATASGQGTVIRVFRCVIANATIHLSD